MALNIILSCVRVSIC